MKKIVLLCALLLSVISSQAQLPAGSLAPNWKLYNINETVTGRSYELDTMLKYGKTVFVMFAPTWSYSAYQYHLSRQLDSLWYFHGPAGEPGVSSTTTDDVMVFMIESEASNSRDQLYDTGTSTQGNASQQGPANTCSQGDWVTGTYYPIIDSAAATTALLSQYAVSYFPTMYMICRDRLAYPVFQPTYTQAYNMVLGGCPNYAPDSSINAKVVPYTGPNYFICKASPIVRFQNYTLKNTNITSANIKVMSGAAVVANYTWSGTLTPFSVASVTIPSTSFITNAPLGPYKYTVTVASDTITFDNSSADSVFKIYNSFNATSLPSGTEVFSNTTPLPFNYSISNDGSVQKVSNSNQFPYIDTSINITGANGAATTALAFNFLQYYNAGFEFIYGDFNTSGINPLALQFDEASAQYDWYSNDTMSVMVSNDCGVTWNTAWLKSGYDLSTAPYNTGIFIPAAPTHWRHISVPLTTYLSTTTNRLIVKFKGHAFGGNVAYIDNINISQTSGVININTNDLDINVYPNPAVEQTTLSITVEHASDVTVFVTDMMGRVVYSTISAMTTGNNTLNIPTALMPAGVYTIKASVEGNTVTRQLSVIK